MSPGNCIFPDLLKTSELLSYPTDDAQWFAWRHETKGLLDLAGAYDAVFGFEEFEDMVAWNRNIDWDKLGANKTDRAVLAQCMLLASIAPEYKRTTQYKGLDLNANPRRLWQYLEQGAKFIRIGGYVN
jgi:hypothetical protein